MAVDTSALMAILLQEPDAGPCSAALARSEQTLISAATMAEALIVARLRDRGEEMTRLLSDLNVEVINLNAAAGSRVAVSYAQWGKGIHPAGLNYGDCFAFQLAMDHDCPLLFVGNDFSETDVKRAL
jgi:ribonuclease VapC